MLRSKRSKGWWNADEGSASLEFITTGVILLVPLVYLIVALASIQAGALAVEGAARQAARVYVQSATPEAGRAAAARAVEFALADHGFEAKAASMTVACAPIPDTCLNRGGSVIVTVRLQAALPLVPSIFDFRTAASVPLSSSAAQTVSRFWGAG
jgi:Flp pilus assembly protein TadG